MQKIGELMQRLLVELESNYAQEPVYQMFMRVFGEHFRVEEKALKIKEGKELSANSLQSPDDLEATYRQKNHKSFRGYVANLTENCDPENQREYQRPELQTGIIGHGEEHSPAQPLPNLLPVHRDSLSAARL